MRRMSGSRPPFTAPHIRSLAFEHGSIAEAEVSLKPSRDLSGAIKRYPKLRAAWERGRFLRNLRDQARRGASVSQAAAKLKLSSGIELRRILDEDIEAADLWDQAQLEVTLEIKDGLIERAKEGNAAAVKALEGLWSAEGPKGAVFDPARVTIKQLCEISGRNRKTIHEWHTQSGLPRNADKTYDLAVFISWFEGFTARKARPNGQAGPLNPFQQVKTERERLELEEKKGELVNIGRTVGWQCAQLKNIMNAFEKITDYANLMFGQPREEIVKVLEDLRDNVAAHLQHVPELLKLSDRAKKKLFELYAVMTGIEEGEVEKWNRR